MEDEDTKAADALADAAKKADQANADEIKSNEATSMAPRGNVHSEASDDEPDFEAPPPHAH